MMGRGVCWEGRSEFVFYVDFGKWGVSGIVMVWESWIGEKGEEVVFEVKDRCVEFVKVVM